MRLDVLLVERGLAPSRERAQALIMEGAVLVEGQPHVRAGETLAADASVDVLSRQPPFVSRGGLKLRKALDVFGGGQHGIHIQGKICLDVGASTGGFTDCLLQAGAARVYAVDVGHGQLDWKLRQDARVVNLEKTNIRSLAELPEVPEVATVDVSFISLTKVLEPLTRLLAPPDRDAGKRALPGPGWANVVLLVKPQFEAGPKGAPKGVVRNPDVHARVLNEVTRHARDLGWLARELTASPITGPAGNREFLLWLAGEGPDVVDEAEVERCLAS